MYSVLVFIPRTSSSPPSRAVVVGVLGKGPVGELHIAVRVDHVADVKSSSSTTIHEPRVCLFYYLNRYHILESLLLTFPVLWSPPSPLGPSLPYLDTLKGKCEATSRDIYQPPRQTSEYSPYLLPADLSTQSERTS